MSSPGKSDRAEGRFTVTNELGLHFRAAAMVVRVTSEFKSKVTISNGQTAANAASVLDLMTLAASMGTELTVAAEGCDADAAGFRKARRRCTARRWIFPPLRAAHAAWNLYAWPVCPWKCSPWCSH